MMHDPIPFNRSSTAGLELDHIAEALQIGQIAGDRTFGRQCETLLQTVLGVQRVLLTTSCTHALEIAAFVADIGPGDEVIVPSFTFVSTANAFAVRGATPVFVDIRPDTLNLDESLVAARITERTRAIVPVHYAGVACALDVILELAARHRLLVIEDNAHGLFGRYRGRPLGTLGTLATQSFHETKNITCGEGGALLINDEHWVKRAEIIREKGTNRSQFFRGQVDKYTWVDVGSSYVLADVLAAFLYGQLQQWQAIQARRRAIWEYYQVHLADWAATENVRLPLVPPECEQPYHMFYVLLPSTADRDRLIEHLRAHHIQAVFHYLPLHLSIMGRRFGGRAGDCPIAEGVSGRLLRLPFFNSLSEAEQERVVGAIREFRCAPR